MYNKSLTSMLQDDIDRQTNPLARAKSNKNKKEDNRRAVVNFRLFVVLRPPSSSNNGEQNGDDAAANQQQTLHMMLNSRTVNSKNYQKLADLSRLSKIARRVDSFAGRNSNGGANSFATMLSEASSSFRNHEDPFASSSSKKITSMSNLKLQQQQERERIRAEADGDEDAIIRDVDADDEADAIWDEHALAVIPFVMQITFSETTVRDVMQKAWPYVVELWRNQGRFWHKNMVPLPISSSSNWFCLRMIGKRWHDPSRAMMRACLEPPVPTILAGFDYSGFEALQTSLAHCSFQERGLNESTLIKRLLPDDPNAHLKSMAASGSKLMMMGGGSRRFGVANTAVSSAVHGGLTDANRRRRDNASSDMNAPLPRYRMNLLLTLSTDYLLLEHLVCCEMQTRKAISRAIDGFFKKMKVVEQTSLDCAFKRALHRQRIEKLFSDLMNQETKRRGILAEQEERVFYQQIRKPYEDSQKTLLPVLREAHAIRLSWRAKLADDIERAKRGDTDDKEIDDDDYREVSPSCELD